MRNLALFSAAVAVFLSLALASVAQAREKGRRAPDDFRIETPLATVAPGHEFVIRVFEGNSKSRGGRVTVHYQNEAGATVLKKSAVFGPGRAAFFAAKQNVFDVGLRFTSARAEVEVVLNDEKAQPFLSFEFIDAATELAAPGGWSCALPAGPQAGTAQDDPERLEMDPAGTRTQAALAPREGQRAAKAANPHVPRCGGGGAAAPVYVLGRS